MKPRISYKEYQWRIILRGKPSKVKKRLNVIGIQAKAHIRGGIRKRFILTLYFKEESEAMRFYEHLKARTDIKQ